MAERTPILTISRSGALPQVLGIIFALLFALLAYAVIAERGNVRVNKRPAVPSDAWFPVLLAAGSLALAGFRWSTEVDLSARTLRRRRRWYGITWGGDEAIGEPQRVECWEEVRGAGKNRRTVRPVALVCSGQRIELGAPNLPLAARRLAEDAARTAAVPLHDRSSGATVVRAPDQLDVPAIRRASEADFALPPAAPGSRLAVDDDLGRQQTVRIAAAPTAIGAAVVISAMFLAVPLVVFLLVLPGHLRWMLLFLGIPLVVAAVAMRALGLFGGSITVGDEGLRQGSTTLTADEIEELVVVDGPTWRRQLRVISDRRELRLACGHDHADLVRLRAILLNGLAGRRVPPTATGNHHPDR
ncbi:MAG: hypothetical protein L6R48_20160 [Planctomycetes bacterium]|nr:hypothetical protein [Planctomycetota bacterium]